MNRLLSLTLICLLGLVAGAGVAVAQLEAYAASHPFALATATTTRLFGMGGISSCIPDRGFANPAFAGQLTHSSKVERGMLTDFDGGLTLKGAQTSVAIPLRRNVDGVQVTGYHLRSNRPVVPLPMPTVYALSENDVSVHYGRRLGGPLLVGIAVSPVFHNAFSAASGPIFLHTRAKAKWGFRAGAAYQLGDRGWVGAVYDRYDEDVNVLTPLGPGNFTFRSQEIVVGVSYEVTEQLLAAIEWQELSSKSGAMGAVHSGWRGGVEGRFDNLSVRLGSNQGGLSLGAGWTWGRYTLNYAYIQDWNDSVLGPIFGGSTTHSLEATGAF